jgi:putative transposase
MTVVAFVFMPEHVHLLVCPRGRNYSVPEFLRSLKQGSARSITNHLRATNHASLPRIRVSRSDGRHEHRIWLAGGGYDRNITSERAWKSTIAYIEANPIRRGLAKRPADWRWSSASMCVLK